VKETSSSKSQWFLCSIVSQRWPTDSEIGDDGLRCSMTRCSLRCVGIIMSDNNADFTCSQLEHCKDCVARLSFWHGFRADHNSDFVRDDSRSKRERVDL